jgi:hypothetical protein
MLQLLSAKDKAEHMLDDILKHFRQRCMQFS